MNLLNPPQLDKVAVKKSFNRSASQYDQSAVLQAEIISRLLGRLDFMKVNPELVVDLGCGTGKAIGKLQKKYPKSTVLGLDIADKMLVLAKKQFGLFGRKWLINADMEHLPLKEDSVDLLFSSLALQWSNDLKRSFSEFKRVGRKGGLLMFTTFGVDTLKELRESWSRLDSSPHVHHFMDMHDLGDLMLSAGLSEVVMDREMMTVEFRSFIDLMRDLKSIGATNASSTRSRGLLTTGKLNELEKIYKEIAFQNGCYKATYEVVYGHAWF